MCHCLHHSHDHSRKKKCIISSSFSVSFITLFSVTVLNKLYQDGAHHNLIPGCLLLHRKYRRMGSSGAHRYLAHTAYQAHAVFLTKSHDKKRTALIEQKFGVGKVKYSTTGLEQACSANDDQGSLLQQPIRTALEM